jgi:hypothetical protein
VPIEVVGSDVEDDAGMNPGLLDRFELEARELEDDPVLGRDVEIGRAHV